MRRVAGDMRMRKQSTVANTAPKILIVDDNEFMRWAIRDMIKKSRPEWELCGEASNGEEAVQAVISLEPDVVLLDESMPRMTGLSAAAQIKKLGLRTRVLLLTAYELQDLSDAGGTEAFAYVDKSHAARDLVPAIEALITQRARHRRSRQADVARRDL